MTPEPARHCPDQVARTQPTTTAVPSRDGPPALEARGGAQAEPHRQSPMSGAGVNRGADTTLQWVASLTPGRAARGVSPAPLRPLEGRENPCLSNKIS